MKNCPVKSFNTPLSICRPSPLLSLSRVEHKGRHWLVTSLGLRKSRMLWRGYLANMNTQGFPMFRGDLGPTVECGLMDVVGFIVVSPSFTLLILRRTF